MKSGFSLSMQKLRNANVQSSECLNSAHRLAPNEQAELIDDQLIQYQEGYPTNSFPA